MEILEIENFLTIKEAKLEIRPFTILIGPQANGKSVVVKLLYFFRDFLAADYAESIGKQVSLRELEKGALNKFEQIFPKYAWSDQELKIVYSTDEYQISIYRISRAGKKASVKFELSASLCLLQRKFRKAYKNKIDSMKAEKESRPASSEIRLINYIFDTLFEHYGSIFRRSIFIPASRSFFANLQKNVFTFLASNIAIDPLIKEFGSVYESSKRFEARKYGVNKNNISFYQSVKQEFEKILAGQYLYEDDQDWIISDKRKINLANASSGQQEMLPLFLVLLFFGVRTGNMATFFIEEPEAHLFPTSQRRLIGVFSRLYDEFKHNFILTTHSPYVLTALNNLIMASNLIQKNTNKISKAVKEIIGEDRAIPITDVSAYTIQNGLLESIIDKETQLIGSSIIDSVSDEFDEVFDRLTEMEMA
jgi:predicted ATPase